MFANSRRGCGLRRNIDAAWKENVRIEAVAQLGFERSRVLQVLQKHSVTLACFPVPLSRPPARFVPYATMKSLTRAVDLRLVVILQDYVRVPK